MAGRKRKVATGGAVVRPTNTVVGRLESRNEKGQTPTEVRAIRDNPEAILAELRKANKPLLGDLFHGDEYAQVRRAITKVGYYDHGSGRLHVKVRPVAGTEEHEVMAIATSVSRDPGRSDSTLTAIQDFQPLNTSQEQKVQLYRQLYLNEGIVNNAVTKISAILSGGGSFKVRKAKRGKARKAVTQLQEILYQWTKRVNASGEESVVTGSRGLKAINHQGVRQSLIEGSWVGRTIWTKADLGSLGSFDLPMAIHSISTANLEPMRELVGTGLEAFFWKPPANLVRELRKPSNKDAGNLIKKFIPNDIAGPLKKDGKVLLDPALLLHVKNRGVDSEPFGESFIQPAMSAIAYRRAIDDLDLVVMQNLINRVLIVMVGSSDPESPYSKSDVASARQALMQSFFAEPGPNMTIIWQGDDVNVKDIGAHNSILDLDDRHKIAENKVKISLGVPDALLSGTTSDGKSSGWAATIGAAAQLEELQNRFSQIWTTLGERIALENNFTDIDLIYEFDQSLIVDRLQEMTMSLQAYQTGLMGIQTSLERMGINPDAEFTRRAEEQGLDPGDESLTWDQVFMPPQGLAGQGAPPPGQGGGKPVGKGRTPKDQTGKTGPDRKPKPTTTENK